MEFAAGPPSKWLLTHRESGDVIEVWADSVAEEEGCFVFSILVDATTDEQEALDVRGRAPSSPERVIVTVARFPTTTIENPRGA